MIVIPLVLELSNLLYLKTKLMNSPDFLRVVSDVKNLWSDSQSCFVSLTFKYLGSTVGALGICKVCYLILGLSQSLTRSILLNLT